VLRLRGEKVFEFGVVRPDMAAAIHHSSEQEGFIFVSFLSLLRA
jgi:hypothetical protein